MEFINESVKTCYKERKKLSEKWQGTRIKLNNANMLNRAKRQKEYDEAFNEMLNYSRNVYAKAIYDAYSNIKPLLVRVKTGEKIAWDNLFSKRFEALDSMYRDILVGLIEGGGYKFAD